MFSQLSNLEQWRTLKFRSKNEPKLIFKHSNTSPDSAETLQKIRDAQDQGIVNRPIHLVVVQENKEIADTIEKDLATKHQLAQIIVMFDSQAVYSAAGAEIDLKKVSDFLG